MNVLVLGADGYSGAHLVSALLERGHTVRGLVRDLERGAALEKQGMDLRVGDLCEIESIKALAPGSEIIFNLVGYCRDEPATSKKVLLDGTRNLIEIVDSAALSKYIWASNVSLYGYPAPNTLLDERTAPKPAYGLGKLTVEAEKLVRDHLPAVTLRVASIYGPGRDFVSALREGRLRLLNQGKNWQSRIHIDDWVQILLAAMERAEPGSLFVVGDDMPTNGRDFFAELAQAVGVPLPPNLEVTAARGFSGVARALNWLSAQEQYQVNENVIGLATGNYYLVNEKLKRTLGAQLKYPSYKEGYADILNG